MKTTNPSLKFCRPALTSLAIAIVCAFSIRPAQAAGYTVTLLRVGPDVVATGSGAIDFTGLAPYNVFNAPPQAQIEPDVGDMWTGATATVPDAYQGGGSGASWTGPTHIGNGSGTNATSSTGDFVGIIGFYGGYIIVPTGYLSGDPLSDSAIFSGQNFQTLGVDRGTYVWNWGSGVNQNFTLQVGPVGAPLPDSGSTFGLLCMALLALFGVTRFRSLRLA